jgi:spore maturation protein CgeB
VRGLKLNKLYWSTKIVVGDTLCIDFKYPDYWSDRVYETLGRGGFLIHPYVSGMEREFEDKKHLVFYEYGNFKQLKELIDYYLEHDEEREAIRKAGHELVKEKYTYKNRWEYILKELGI